MEKDIAEINILYFLYMKYEGDIRRICLVLKCDTIDKVLFIIVFLTFFFVFLFNLVETLYEIN